MSRLVLPRRFLVLVALLFWQGGFTFYAAVVVPVGQHLFGDVVQGQVTRQVTDYLNLSGAIALAVLGLDVLGAADPARARRRGRWLLWAGMLLLLGLLFALHPRLDALMDADRFERRTFRPYHRIYLWSSTIQWAFGIGFAWLTLAAWRAEDGKR